LQTDEYVDFISTISDGYIANDQEYSDLSSVLKVNFSHLSCRCKFNPINAGEDCCLLTKNSGIWLIEGFMNHSKNPWSDDEVSNFEIWLEGESTSEEYLLALCEDTMKAINYERQCPSYAPTHYHIPMPIAQATNNPTTIQPTIPNISSSSPSSHPTINPVTVSPSNHPTTLQPISRSPVSDQPTDWPTWQPTLNPIVSTDQPTISSTEEKDTETPTDNPTEETNDALTLQEIFAIGSRSSPSPSSVSIFVDDIDTSTRTSNVEEEEDAKSSDYILIGSIAASAILFVCCASVACLVKRRRNRNKGSSMTDEEDDHLANVSTYSSSAGNSGWSWGSTNSSRSEQIEEGSVPESAVLEEEDTSTMDMNWVGVGRIASMLADNNLFKDEDIGVVGDSMKGSSTSISNRNRVTKLRKGRKGSPRPSPTPVPIIDTSDSSPLDKDGEKRKRVKHINSLIGKGDFQAVKQMSKKYNTIEHKENDNGDHDQRDRVGSPDSLSDWALIHGGPAL